jgi:dephospho-CoA kinase
MDRAKVSAKAFSDKEALKTLEGILHKIVWDEAEAFMAQTKEADAKLAVLDVPLLIECKWHERVDCVWLVAVSKEQQIKRAMIRSGMTEDEVKARIAAQMSLDDKKKFADVVLDNSGTLEATLEQVRKELEKVLA